VITLTASKMIPGEASVEELTGRLTVSTDTVAKLRAGQYDNVSDELASLIAVRSRWATYKPWHPLTQT
jgi:hypothetical protein